MFQQTTKTQLSLICALRVNTCEVSVYTGQDFHEMYPRLRGPKSLLTLKYKLNLISLP